MNNENDLFLKQMKGVTPIKKITSPPLKKVKEQNKTVKKINIKNFSNTKTEQNRNIKNSHFALENFSIRKNIKKNLLKIDKKIDFHGKNLLEAEDAFSSTIVDCFNKSKRCLLFVTGKGLFKIKDDDEINKPKLYHGVIRAAFFKWVKSKQLSRFILSFEQASIEHGGDGAFYVYLRKNKN